MRRPLPSPKSPLWCCASLPSPCGSVSPRPTHARLGPGPATVSDCAAFALELTRPCAAFFRLLGLPHVGGIPLKAGILIQNRARRIANGFGIHNLFVLHFPRIRLTQIPHALGLGIDHHDILVTMRFLLATVVQGLFCRAFRALPPPIGPVNDQFRPLRWRRSQRANLSAPGSAARPNRPAPA